MASEEKPIVGRAAEVAYLEQCLEAALGGERQVVFVSGEPGIGKTTLVNAFLQRLTGAESWEFGSGPYPSQSSNPSSQLPTPQVRVGWGQCIEQYGAGEAYLPLLEAGTRLCQGPEGAQAIALLRQYAPTWLVQLPGVSSDAEWELLQRRVQGATRERMLREAAEVVARFTQEQGYVLVLEDLHWSDGATLEWLAYIARRREPAKLLIIGTYRPQDVLVSSHPLRGIVQDLSVRNRCEELRLAPLSEQSVSDYLSNRFSHAVATSSLPALIHRRSGGNPLFMVNMADYLIAQQVLQQNDTEWSVRGDVTGVADNVPQSLQHLIERQLERLPAEAQQVLEIASVVGMEFSAAEVATGLQAEVETIETQCDDLVRKGQFLRALGAEEWPDGTLGERYGFLHALYRDVLYGRLAEARRVRLHRRIGERKEAAYGTRGSEIAAELARHFTLGREANKAVSYCLQAGENAVRCHADQEAVEHFTHGLELLHTLPESPERVQRELQLQIALTTPLKSLKGFAAPEVEQVYTHARTLCQRDEHTPQLTLILGGLTSLYHTRADFRTAREFGDQLLLLSQQVTDPLLPVQAHYKQGATLYDLADLLAARRHFEQALAQYDASTHDDHAARYGGHDPGVGSWQWLALALWRLGYPDQARHSTQQGLALAHTLAHPFSIAWAHYMAAVGYYYYGEVVTSYEHLQTADALAQEYQFAFILALTALSKGWVLVEQGQGNTGIAQIHEGLRMYRETGSHHSLPGYLAVLAGAYARNRQLAEAHVITDEGLALLRATGEQVYEPDLLLVKGELTLAGVGGEKHPPSSVRQPVSENPSTQAEAEECFRQAITIAQQQHAKSLELRASMNLARLWQSQGKSIEARELLEGIYNWFSEGFDTKDLQEAEALLVTLGGRVKAENEKGTKRRTKARENKREENNQFVVPPSPRSLASSFSPSQSPVPNAQSLTLAPTEPRPVTSDAGPRTPDAVFRAEGEYWTLTFNGNTCRLRDTLGMRYLAQLLSRPYQEVHVLTLAAEDVPPTASVPAEDSGIDKVPAGFSDAGEVLDPQARAAYRQRLRDLQEEIEEAQAFNDSGRFEKLQGEIEFLTHELAQAVGLGGRARKAASVTERARINVTKRIKIALRRIGEQHPRLGEHLAQAIRTGTFCVYTPLPHQPVTWQV